MMGLSSWAGWCSLLGWVYDFTNWRSAWLGFIVADRDCRNQRNLRCTSTQGERKKRKQGPGPMGIRSWPLKCTGFYLTPSGLIAGYYLLFIFNPCGVLSPWISVIEIRHNPPGEQPAPGKVQRSYVISLGFWS